MVLQAYCDIAQEKKRLSEHNHPDLSLFRSVVFWDTALRFIDWEKNKPSIIQRVFERGNDQEIQETIRFYGKETVSKHLKEKDITNTIVATNMLKHLQ